MRILILAAVLAAPASATEVIRLSDAQRDAVIAAAANGPEKAPVLTPVQTPRPSVLDRPLYPEFFQGEGGSVGGGVQDRKVHGEMTMFAGSGGTFGVSGTAVMPVGDSGMAAISIAQGTSRFGNFGGFGFGFATGDARRNLGADISNGNGFSPWGVPWAMGPFGPPRRR